jgi:hypothetical protein
MQVNTHRKNLADWTHIEGCYSLPYERLRLQRRKKLSSAVATEDDDAIEYDNKSN